MFADDMNIVSYGFGNLDLSITTCEEWAVNNDMTINKKKSKILFMKGQMKYNLWEKAQKKQYNGYSIALAYKSLGVIIQRNGLFD